MDIHDSLAPLDSPRKNGGLKSTSLAVLAQRKTHRTQTQKSFESFNKQRLTMNLAAQQQYQSAFQPPRYKMSSKESLRSQSSGSLRQYQQQYHQNNQRQQQNQQQQQQQQQQQNFYHEDYYSQSTDSFVPVQPVLPQGTWAEPHDHPRDSIGAYSPSSSEFTFEDAKLTSPDTSHNSDWRESSESTTVLRLEEELAKMKQELERLQLVDSENVKLKAENEALMAQLDLVKSDNDKLLGSSSPVSSRSSPHTPTLPVFNEDDETLYKDLQIKEEELSKTIKLCEELEVKFTDTTQQYNRLKLIHKTNMDMKNKEINRLKEDLKEMDSYLSEKSTSTAASTPMSSPSTDHIIDIGTTKNQPPIQLTQAMNEELRQDLLYTIRTLRSVNESLAKEKQQLITIAERDRRVLRSFAHSSRNKVKIRKGLTLVSEVDTLI